MRVLWVASLLLAGCAAANTGSPDSDAQVGSGSDGGSRDSGTGTGTGECPPDQLAIDVPASGQPTCTAIDTLAQQAIAEHCSAYLGWRDNCDGCTTPPAKWGRAGTGSCSPGVGTNNKCTMPTLDGVAVHLFGLDLDGDMDGNDKLYAGLHCTADTSTGGGVGPCPPGQIIDGFNGTAWTCSSFAKAAIAYVQTSCSVYLGWRDNCDGCVTAPSKWGFTSEVACQNGAGADNTCLAPTLLGTESVRLFGLNTDGDVDDNDKFHVALRCETPAPQSTTQSTACPPGQFVAATLPGGKFRCDSAGPVLARYFADHCTLYFGWRDSCDGCMTPPAKWGRIRVGACANGAGVNNTCAKLTLGQPIEVFGLNTDGNVDENDMLYVGFRCD